MNRKDIADKYKVSVVTVKNWVETFPDIKEKEIKIEKGRRTYFNYPDNIFELIEKIVFKREDK